MRIPRRQAPLRLFCIALATIAPAAVAQIADLDMRLPMDIISENTTYDGKNSMIIFSGLRLTQGVIRIEADEGRATRMELEDATWRFSGNVVIDVGIGHIECDSADLFFDEFRLRTAVVKGSPATYDLRRQGAEEQTHAQADLLKYDVDAGVIEFSGDATITEGGNQISSHMLVYNIEEQRINAGASGEEDGRVRIKYTPANGVDLPGANDVNADDESP